MLVRAGVTYAYYSNLNQFYFKIPTSDISKLVEKGKALKNA